jgi:phenylpropionate dioxygenase-like ring-hydroxylating dioxygenase large terminal subunit
MLAMIDDPVLLNDWHVVGRVSEIAFGQPQSVRLLGEDLVLWRNRDGIHVWKDLCIHRGAKLSSGKVANECLVCPYHGWTYASDGVCCSIPAHPSQRPPPRAQTIVYQVKERYGLVWVCLGNPAQDVPLYREWDDPAFKTFTAGPYRMRASGPRIIENFLDVAHFPFVHAGYLGDPAHTEIEDYEVETGPDSVIARDIGVWQPDPDGSGKPARVSYTYEVLRPLTARFSKFQGDHVFSMIDIVTPVTETESVAWPMLSTNYDTGSSDEEFIQFQDVITAQDVPVVESQRPELLPLDLQAELHLRSDRTAIAYRQWLRKLGLRFGTA